MKDFIMKSLYIKTLISLSAFVISSTLYAATITVNSTKDTAKSEQTCTLRDAITAANTDSKMAGCAAGNGADTIAFNIPGNLADLSHGKFIIAPSTSLPPIVEQVNIDATTQPGFNQEPLIVLSGKDIVGPLDLVHYGFNLQNHNGSVIRGFIINDYLQDPGTFPHIAINILEGGNHTIVGNWLGMDATGLLPRPNGRSIFIEDSEMNLIGGENQSDRNILSGNTDDSAARYFVILLVNSHHNRIEGNWLGLDKTGMVALPNNGEAIDIVFSNYNIVGGSEAKRNIISATQKQQAVQVEDAGGNEISYNCLGTNKDCEVDQASYDTSPFANGFVVPHDTMDILSFDPNVFGNENEVLYNVVAQNGSSGIAVVSIDVGGGNTMSDTVVEGNTFINSRYSAIDIITDGASSVLDGVIVRGNIINNKTLPLDGSVSDGIMANGIINDLLIDDNTVSNSRRGILYKGKMTNSMILNNNLMGGENGIWIDSAAPFSPSAGMENILIDGNSVREYSNEGITLLGSINNVSVIDNEITDNGSHGLAAVGSTQVTPDFSSGNTVVENVGIENGLLKDNQIYNNGGIGVYLGATLNMSFENIQEDIIFNRIFETGDFDYVFDTVSTDYALYEIRNDAVTNGSNDDFDLLLFTDTFDLIAAPFQSGSDEQIPVFFDQGTYIVGVEAFQVGTPLEPLSSFSVFKTSANIQVEVADRGHNIEMSGNAIYGNAGLGIDLSNEFNVDDAGVTQVPDGVTADMEADNGPNGLQNFPELLEAKFVDSAVQVKGNLNSKPNTTYRLEFFANSEVDASGNGEGERPLGTKFVSTNANGLANNFVTHLSDENVNAGDYITATATDVDTGRTSEFSVPVSIRIIKHSK
jgi:CSLREA domain-containing protein